MEWKRERINGRGRRKAGLKKRGIFFLFSLVFVLLRIGFSLRWRRNNWENLTFFELITQLKSLSGVSKESILNFAVEVLLPSLIIFFILLTLSLLLYTYRRNKEIKRKKAILLTPLCFSLVCSFCLSFPESIKAYQYLGISDYLHNASKPSEFIDDNYVSPNETTLTFPEKKKNLIILFRESRERTYSDKEHGGYEQENYIPQLTDLARERECFSDSLTLNGATPLTYTTWTRAALFSYTCGLPFKTSLGQNNRDTQETFFPHVVSLGDILNTQGYDQTFLCGSDASFAGRKLYFQSHGNYAIHDFYTYQEKYGVGVENQWGFRDYHLFDYAKEEIKEKGRQYDEKGIPFNYDFLTVDTHFYVGGNGKQQDGFLCEKCQDNFPGNQYANVIACSSRQASDFVSWFYGKDGNEDVSLNTRENTTLVLLGDHETRSGYFCKQADKDGYDRKTYVCFINSQKTRKNKTKRIYSHFDIFPTLLSSIGVDIEGDKLSLGVDLFSDRKTYLEENDKDYINQQLQGKSKVIDSLLEVNPYEYSYLKRRGRLPSASSSYEEKEEEILFLLSGLKKNGLDEELIHPKRSLTIKGEEKEYLREEKGKDYILALNKEELRDKEGKLSFTCSFTREGKTSGNIYSLSTLEVKSEEEKTSSDTQTK